MQFFDLGFFKEFCKCYIILKYFYTKLVIAISLTDVQLDDSLNMLFVLFLILFIDNLYNTLLTCVKDFASGTG